MKNFVVLTYILMVLSINKSICQKNMNSNKKGITTKTSAKNMTFSEHRQLLHSMAELSGKEAKTSRYLRQLLTEMGVTKLHHGFAQESFIAEIDSKKPGPVILLRSELDALPIKEINSFKYRSKVAGVSHKCGHDGHSATLIKVAHDLMKEPLKKGKVLLFFQSAEENGQGAKAAVDSGIFDQFGIDYVFAYHNWPGLPLGSIIGKSGPITASVESIVLDLKGATSHASQPDLGRNPALATAELINYFHSLNQKDKNSDQFFITTPVHIDLGEKAYGISAGHASIGYTIRTWTNDYMQKQKKNITEAASQITTKHRLDLKISWLESFFANINHEDAIHLIRIAADEHKYKYDQVNTPFEGGEDFGYITNKYKGAMFMIGAGENCPPLHSEDYDFPDELIDIGANMFLSLIRKISD